jgi:5-bromo-4-chloroindolyl phosphate hydrolysis protein
MARDAWAEFLNSTPAWLLMLAAILAMLIAIGCFIIGKLRSSVRETGPTPSDFMSNFRELYARGELSDKEFRTIKAKLASSLRQQLKVPESEVVFREEKPDPEN